MVGWPGKTTGEQMIKTAIKKRQSAGGIDPVYLWMASHVFRVAGQLTDLIFSAHEGDRPAIEARLRSLIDEATLLDLVADKCKPMKAVFGLNHRLIAIAREMLTESETNGIGDLDELAIDSLIPILRDAAIALRPLVKAHNQETAIRRCIPSWNKAAKSLKFAGEKVGSLRRAGRNLFAILDTFEESSWPPQIDDPLPRNDSDQVERRNSAIAKLNSHFGTAIRFGVSGEKVYWAPINRAID
jgi:hypothetical protein